MEKNVASQLYVFFLSADSFEVLAIGLASADRQTADSRSTSNELENVFMKTICP